jgi:Bax protein
VRTFPDLLASVRAYMLNLNSFYAYEGFRQNRALYNQSSARFDDVLAELSVYAEIGDEYVETLQIVITQNDFNRFNEIKLKAPIF